MSLPKTIWWCESHRVPDKTRGFDPDDPKCWKRYAGQPPGHCDMVELPVAGPDDLVIRREDGKWPEFAITTLAAAFINNERGVGQHPDVVLDLLAAAEGGEE